MTAWVRVAEPRQSPRGSWWIFTGDRLASGPYKHKREAKRAIRALFGKE